MQRRDLRLAAGAMLLLTIAIVRFAVPDRSRLRAPAIEALHVDGERVEPASTSAREVVWTAPADVYVLGWSPAIRTPAGASFDADLRLYEPSRRTLIFLHGPRAAPPGTVGAREWHGLPFGTGFRVGKNERLALRYRITNTGSEAFDSNGATALVYYAPVQGS